MKDEKEWNYALFEAHREGAFAFQLRALFCFILLRNESPNGLRLWEKHKRKLSDDMVREATLNGLDEEFGYNQALLEIQRELQSANREMQDYRLPEPERDERYDRNNMAEVQAQVEFDIFKCRDKYLESRGVMNREQREFLDLVTAAIDNDNTRPIPMDYNVLFLDAPAGTGKTFMFNAILNYVRSQPPDALTGERHIGLAVAASGIASLLMAGGRTVHNRFGLGKDVDANTSCDYSRSENCALYVLIKRCDVIIWDECTMSGKHIVNSVDRCLRDIMVNNKPFGGKLLIFGGDFRQTLCVVEGGNEPKIVSESIINSRVWKHVKSRHLKENIRVKLKANDQNRERLN